MFNISFISDNIQVALVHLPDYVKLTGLSGKREIEKGAALFLLEKMLGESVEISYTTEGKPLLKNKNCHISISHSHDKLAIIVNKTTTTGIDIELIRDKVFKIQHKFLSEPELIAAGNNTIKLITYWACKEALYKYYGKKEVDFIRNLSVSPIQQEEKGILTGTILLPAFEKKVQLQYEKTGDYMLVYTLNEVE